MNSVQTVPATSTANQIDFPSTYPSSWSEDAAYTMKKTGPHFTIYYNSDDYPDADRTLAVLEQEGVPLYRRYFGIEPAGIMVYLTETAEKYIRQSGFPGESRDINVTGRGSCRNGSIFLYKPFAGSGPGYADELIVHEGAHAVISRYLGYEGYSRLPKFLDEGLAHHVEYVLTKGPAYDPFSTISAADILTRSLWTGTPYLITPEQLARRCGSYGELSYQCRAQGTYTVWYVEQTYGICAWPQFLATLNETQDWESALESVTGKTTNQLGHDIVRNLTAMAAER